MPPTVKTTANQKSELNDSQWVKYFLQTYVCILDFLFQINDCKIKIVYSCLEKTNKITDLNKVSCLLIRMHIIYFFISMVLKYTWLSLSCTCKAKSIFLFLFYFGLFTFCSPPPPMVVGECQSNGDPKTLVIIANSQLPRNSQLCCWCFPEV